MAFDETKVDPEHADLFYSGKPGDDGRPVGVTDEEWDEQKARLRKHDAWPYDHADES